MTKQTPQPAPTLTTRQRQFLRAMAHSLNPLVQIGKQGITPHILQTVGVELMNHELIKVKIAANSGLEKHATSKTVAKETVSALVQLIGKTFVLYKPNNEKEKAKMINLPRVKSTTTHVR